MPHVTWRNCGAEKRRKVLRKAGNQINLTRTSTSHWRHEVLRPGPHTGLMDLEAPRHDQRPTRICRLLQCPWFRSSAGSTNLQLGSAATCGRGEIAEKSWSQCKGADHDTRPHKSGATHTFSPGVRVFVRCNLRLRDAGERGAQRGRRDGGPSVERSPACRTARWTTAASSMSGSRPAMRSAYSIDSPLRTRM
jgi:hypothetical protein